MIKSASQRVACSKWFLPATSLGLGVVILAASWAGGHLAQGLISLGVMAAVGLLVLVSGRSETVRGLRGDGRDERFVQIDLRATAAAGQVVIVVLVVAWLVALARGQSGQPYDWLLAISGLTYLLTIAFFRWRG